ncbi:MAG TPA: hypothetical protein VIF40_18010 [Methylosinus sp.]|jgi:hypothetical protein|uniref:hypothetical protein n=1 Tax=Methylosinus sp. TaxID=427 RepID=UPI002F936307
MATAGQNSIDPTTVKRFLGEAMRVYEKLDAQKIANMNECRQIRAPLKDIKKAAKNAGLPKAAFNSLIKSELAKRTYDRAVENATPEDDEDVEAWEQMRAIANEGDLFDAAVKANAPTGDDETDLRPRHLRDQEAERLRENGERVMMGIKKLDEKAAVIGLPGADATEA